MRTTVVFALALAEAPRSLVATSAAATPTGAAARGHHRRARLAPPPPEHIAADIAIDLSLNAHQTAALAKVLSVRRTRMQAQRSARLRIDADTDKQLDAALGSELATRVRDRLHAHQLPAPPRAATTDPTVRRPTPPPRRQPRHDRSRPMKRNATVSIVALVALVVCASAIAAPPPTPPPPMSPPIRHRPAPDDAPPPPQASFGAPLPGLSSAEMQRFRAGLDEFNNVETPQSGLGPIFNGPSCLACHGSPSAGGAGLFLATRFGRVDANGFDPLTALGGSLQQLRAIAPAALEVVPPQANVIARRQAPPLYGFGLIEAIPDAEIVANAQRPQPDGIHGLPSEVADRVGGGTRIGRFGWKAQVATLLEFAADAYVNEMGITNRLFPDENAPNGNAVLLARFDHVADPEDTVDPATGEADIDVAADFMRLLAPPPRLPESREAHDGEQVFADTGCSACHTPVMQTGSSPIAALDHKPVALYSDLLLHDMGPKGDGIAQAFASPTEMRTAPLWGLRASAPYMHDGSAPNVDQAIRAHDGEASVVRDRYIELPDRERQDLLAFLATL